MLTRSQEKTIRSLQLKKFRRQLGLCLVEGKKVIETAGTMIEYIFTNKDTPLFNKLTTTETPQTMAGIAKIPQWSKENILNKDLIIILDGVQDPGNVGSILRLCLGSNASLILIDSVDVSSPKVIRSSAGAMFLVPWVEINRKEIKKLIKQANRPVYRLEKREKSIIFDNKIKTPAILVAGSEGHGISDDIEGISVFLNHDSKLESLNVSQALAIAMYLIKN